MKLIYISGVILGVGLFFQNLNNERHVCKEKEYQEAYLNCMKDREKVREILRGDSLHTLLYW
jgi:hypothetical protein